MATRTVSIRLKHLLCPNLTPCAKLVAIGLQMDRHLKRKNLRSPSRLRRVLGPSRTTIRHALAALAQRNHPRVPDDLIALTRLQVRIGKELITDTRLPALARVIYCILVGLKQLRKEDVLSSYAKIAEVVGMQARTVRRAVYKLVAAGWLAVEQKNKHAPVHFSFPDPRRARQKAEVRRAQQYIENKGLVGESLAHLWCDTLVVPSLHMDNCYPEFLTNPKTGELLQADRYYVDQNVIIEFQGPQHDGPTERFSEQEVRAQMERDSIKREICARLRVPLIELRPEDLTFYRLQKLLGKYLPLRKRKRGEPIIRFLESESRRYRRSITHIRRQSGQGYRERMANPNRPAPSNC